MYRIVFLTALASTVFGAPEWVERSNGHAKAALDVIARFSPEAAGSLGLEDYDEKILDLKTGVMERSLKAHQELLADLGKRLAAEKDPLVRQDLQIMIDNTEDQIRGIELSYKYSLPYFNVARTIFGGIQDLLDDQVAESRRAAALVRLRRYVGMEEGYTPLTALAEQRTRERFSAPGLLGPSRDEVEKDLKNANFFVDGIAQLFAKYKLEGYQEAHARLKTQIGAYNEFIRKAVLPRSRSDFRLPPELYAHQLHSYGVDIPPKELAEIAHKAFDEFQTQMKAVAAVVAKERGFASSDYREVIRELKKQQFSGDQIVDHYKTRIGEIEAIIRRENLVTLPDRPARMRLASEAESAGQPAPHMRPPRLIGNKGESGEFVLPLVNPSAKGQRMDDFTFSAASWTLTAHEARPGHEMQFSKMIENGVSTARAVFAFNSTNVEGWGLYSEYFMFPFMPAEGQLISLQHRMMRAARAFLDPELQAGKVTPAQAKEILLKDVVLSDPMATQEVDRYTFRAPGQATSYFYGYTKLLALRKDVEKKLGGKFSAKAFHDFILSQGLLPPQMLRTAVVEHFAQ